MESALGNQRLETTSDKRFAPSFDITFCPMDLYRANAHGEIARTIGVRVPS